MNLEILKTSFAVTDSPGLDTLDPRMGEVSDLLQAGDFVAAARIVEDLLQQGICDLRLVGYLAFGQFLEHGVAGLLAIVEGLTHVMEESWEAFGPASQREKGCQSSLTWFVKQMMKRLQREEGAQGAQWSAWIASVTPDDVDTTVRRMMRLQGAVDERLGAGGAAVLDGLSKLRSWLDGFRNAVPYPEEEPEPEPEPEATAEEEPAAQAPASQAAPAWGAPAWGPAPDLGAAGFPAGFQASPHLVTLIRKLDAFARLVEQEKYSRALIIADDVNDTLQHFDPTLFFPSFFKTFARLQALHAGDLVAFADYRDTPEWAALQTLYRVDLDEFVSLEARPPAADDGYDD